jgi:hypothetical protein
MLTIKTEGAIYVVLHSEPDESWPSGAPALVQMAGPTITSHPVNAAALPAPLAAWQGRRVALYDRISRVCSGTIDKLLLLNRVYPHFGTLQGWSGETGEPDAKPLPKHEVAQEAWDLGTRPLLVGEIGHSDAACGSPAWARAAEQAEPPMFDQVDASDARDVSEAVLREFRKLTAWKTLQEEFKSWDQPLQGASWDHYAGASPEVHVWKDDAGARYLAHVGAIAGDGCGDYFGSLGALYEVRRSDKGLTLVLLSDASEPGENIVPEGVIDADGDGTLELVVPGGVMQRVGPVWKKTLDVSAPDFDCPC